MRIDKTCVGRARIAAHDQRKFDYEASFSTDTPMPTLDEQIIQLLRARWGNEMKWTLGREALLSALLNIKRSDIKTPFKIAFDRFKRMSPDARYRLVTEAYNRIHSAREKQAAQRIGLENARLEALRKRGANDPVAFFKHQEQANLKKARNHLSALSRQRASALAALEATKEHKLYQKLNLEFIELERFVQSREGQR